MTMFTRCTACGATFRVTLEHLEASAGQVRCGVCNAVFDAFVSLSATDPRGAPPAGSQAAAREDRLPPPVPEPPPRAGEPAPSAAREPRGVPEAGAAALRGVSGASSAPAAASGSLPRTVPSSVEEEPPLTPATAHLGNWLATTAVIVLLAMALVQATYFLRAELAARVPVLRPWLEQACAPLGCTVPLPHSTDQLSIEGSDLQALDPARPGRVLLTATIRNRAPFAQAWPMLELTLTNARDQVSIRRVFSAAEYLAPVAPGKGIGPGAEATVRLRLEAQELQPSGYRLYLFHP